MKQVMLFFLCGILTSSSFCQKKDTVNNVFTYKNNLQIELLGHEMLYCLHYERVLLNLQKYKTNAQIGIEYFAKKSLSEFRIPFMLTEIRSFNMHHIEVGLGFVFVKSHIYFGDKIFTSGQGRLGYRFQKPNGRFLFRVSFTPLLVKTSSPDSAKNLVFHPWGGFSFGYCF
jgi:hypothetical protein